jgi:hypothetical protein
MFGATFVRNIGLTLFLVCIVLLSFSVAQLPFPTSRGDNARDAANTNELLLSPSNVTSRGFGHLFSTPIDYVAMAQPLYMPNVNIPGQGMHNVVYVATMADSVYAIDADTGAQLWWVNFTNPAQGIYTAQGANKTLPCYQTTGFNQEGITGTPVIDTNTNTIYMVAKTVVNGTVEHHLHALDITTGNEQPGSPVQIAAQSVSNAGTVMTFNSFYMNNRPGLLLLNGVVYIGWGGNSCNDKDSGWILGYDETSLAQVAVFNDSPDVGLASIWQTGQGLAADSEGNIYVETAESGVNAYNVNTGGQTYCNSIIKLSTPSLQVAGYFTPYDVAYLNRWDMDLSSTGVLILPDQQGGPSEYGHELVASGKQGFIYVLDRDNMGGYAPNDAGLLQPEIPLIPGITDNTTSDALFSSPAYWNNTVYFAPDSNTPTAYPLSSGLLGTPLPAGTYAAGHSPSISAFGNTNGILWIISGPGSSKHPVLLAFDAVSLQLLYSSTQATGKRDVLPQVGHFVTQTVTNGKVYVATMGSLETYGLLQVATVTGGSGQTGTVGTPLPMPIQVQATNPYSGQPVVGVTVTFSDNCKKTCGSFNPPSATTDSNGNVSTVYTLSQKAGTYTITVSGQNFSSVTATETATAGTPKYLLVNSGGRQTGPAGTVLPNPLSVQVQDAYKNPVSGITVNFAPVALGSTNPTSMVTGATGIAQTYFTLPTITGSFSVIASTSGVKNATFPETAVAGPAASVTITGGNNQTASAGSTLPQALTVVVADQYGNPVSGNSVAFSDGGVGGIFVETNPSLTNSKGVATQIYTLPLSPQTVSITATAAGVSTPAIFTETGD